MKEKNKKAIEVLNEYGWNIKDTKELLGKLYNLTLYGNSGDMIMEFEDEDDEVITLMIYQEHRDDEVVFVKGDE